MDDRTGAKYVRLGRLGSHLWRVRAFATADQDGELIETEPDEPWWWAVEPAEPPGIARILIGPALLADPPPLWFVHVDEPSATPPATNLVAFDGAAFARGTVVSKFTFGSAGVPNDSQVGAVRWMLGDGRVHQVFVAPAWRRRRAASAILYAADAFHQALGRPGRLHGDGNRTAMGQLLLDQSPHPQRIRTLERLMPPMDRPPSEPA